MLQVYIGRDLQYTQGYPMVEEWQMLATFEDFIHDVGAPYLFFTDNANAETSNRVKEILCIYTIKDHQSEPHNQHQNYA